MSRNSRARKQFRVNDVITWGRGVRHHAVVEVRHTDLLVDVTTEPDSSHWLRTIRRGDRLLYPVLLTLRSLRRVYRPK